MKKAFKHPAFAAAGLTGILVGTSYPPFPAWALFFCLFPLWRFWRRSEKATDVLVSGFIAQFLLTFIGFNWVYQTAVEYGHLPWFVSVLILIAFCSFASLHFVIAGLIAWGLKRRWPIGPGFFFLMLAALTAAGEWFYPMIFPWNMGYPLLYNKFHSAQLAEWIGFQGLSFLVLLANAAFAYSIEMFPKKNWSFAAIAVLLLFFGAEVTGSHLEKSVPPEDLKLNVLMVQPNVGNFDKFLAERGQGYQEPVVKKDFEITEQGLKNDPAPDLVVWPETAYPASLDPAYQYDYYVQSLSRFVSNHRIHLVTGAYSDDPPWAQPHRSFNAMFAIQDNGLIEPVYRKYALLAFGEYFPGAEYFPFLKNIVPEISDFARGPGPTVFRFPGVTLSPLICYEALDTLYVRRALELGGQVMINATNDSWFGKMIEPYQHMIMSAARAVEYRRPLVRVTNTGLSVAFDARGRNLITGPQDTEWAGSVTVLYHSHPPTTLYSRLAPYLGLIFLSFALIFFLVGRFCSDIL